MDEPRPPKKAVWQAVAYAWQFGYTIVIPLVVFAVGGRLADQALGTAPWLFLAGVVLAIILSSIAVTRAALKLIRDQSNPPPPSV